ncbi:BLUF domain-containing protein [Rathayibacter sp. VKM Ac-2630]|uniref:BLUF domain-containing protein n=1 Tax=Rathayibacter sp. VKM Ac-2630 TaxID=1938617 RepID=UPI000980FD9C|nr:BLUF domain-containing protein [Rathayibacter sp. VKM Ac-2630]OOB92279.1 hypothetical protein B0T42_01285 [Rathayibacter sp. VKM Ac-2630]
MLSVTYVSTAAESFGDADLAELLRQSRDNNARSGLTGMLLFKNGRFMQVLEGEEEDVRERYRAIAADPRHTDVTQLLSESIEGRRFPQWSMGFPTPEDAELRRAPGYDAFFDSPQKRRSSWDEPSRAQLLLDWFRQRA